LGGLAQRRFIPKNVAVACLEEQVRLVMMVFFIAAQRLLRTHESVMADVKIVAPSSVHHLA
jgi:hypothetical protein